MASIDGHTRADSALKARGSRQNQSLYAVRHEIKTHAASVCRLGIKDDNARRRELRDMDVQVAHAILALANSKRSFDHLIRQHFPALWKRRVDDQNRPLSGPAGGGRRGVRRSRSASIEAPSGGADGTGAAAAVAAASSPSLVPGKGGANRKRLVHDDTEELNIPEGPPCKRTRIERSSLLGGDVIEPWVGAGALILRREEKKMAEWTTEDVCTWLASSVTAQMDHLNAYVQAFSTSDVNGETLLTLTNAELEKDLGVKMLHRRKILKLISDHLLQQTSNNRLDKDDPPPHHERGRPRKDHVAQPLAASQATHPAGDPTSNGTSDPNHTRLWCAGFASSLD
jgi:hypothetical protein